MRSSRSILLYANEVAGSDVALRRAAAVAAANEASLSVVDVLPNRDRPWSTLGGPESRRAAVAARLRELELLVAPARRRLVPVQVKVPIGRPSVELIREVLRQGHDLVALNAGTDEGRPGPLFGRTDLRLLKHCPCSVWLTQHADHGRRGRVLAALDADEDWSERQSESIRVLEHAVSIAQASDSELRIVCCLGHWSPGNWPEVATTALGSHRRWLDDLLARCDLRGVRHDVRLERAAAVEVIAAHRDEIDVLVMGTVWRSGPAGVLICDTAEDALARLDCSVLAVKPEGLRTPQRFGDRPGSRASVARWRAA